MKTIQQKAGALSMIIFIIIFFVFRDAPLKDPLWLGLGILCGWLALYQLLVGTLDFFWRRLGHTPPRSRYPANATELGYMLIYTTFFLVTLYVPIFLLII